jgi:hypothetical protein
MLLFPVVMVTLIASLDAIEKYCQRKHFWSA